MLIEKICRRNNLRRMKRLTFKIQVFSISHDKENVLLEIDVIISVIILMGNNIYYLTFLTLPSSRRSYICLKDQSMAS